MFWEREAEKPPVRSWADPELMGLPSSVEGPASGQAVITDGAEIAKPINYNSFSGTDLQCLMYVPGANRLDQQRYADPRSDQITRKLFAELQTLTISSTRNVYPVRRLNESSPFRYTRGARTIAGTLIFSVLSRDVLAEFYRYDKQEIDDGAPFFVDQIPAFSIFIHGANEMGGVVNAALLNVTLVNFGQTLSVDDIYLESTYTYVAQYFLPFVDDPHAFLQRRTDIEKKMLRPASLAWEFPHPKTLTDPRDETEEWADYIWQKMHLEWFAGGPNAIYDEDVKVPD